jgi:hypothetical protein
MDSLTEQQCKNLFSKVRTIIHELIEYMKNRGYTNHHINDSRGCRNGKMVLEFEIFEYNNDSDKYNNIQRELMNKIQVEHPDVYPYIVINLREYCGIILN